MLNLFGVFKNINKEKKGVAALEFAMTAPILLAFMAGSYDITQVLIAQERMSVAATAVAEMVTSMSAQNDGTNVISGDNTELAANAVYSYLPQWETINPAFYSVTVSSFTMSLVDPTCTSNCTYQAKTAWSASLNYGSANRRACTYMAQSPPQAASQGTLPSGLFGPAPLIAVDITFNYIPMFFGFLSRTVPITRSAFLTPRIGGNTDYVTYTPSADISAATSPTALGYVVCS